MRLGKNIHTNFEIYNCLNMKQNIDLTFCTQQELDSFSPVIFTQRNCSYRRSTYFTEDLPKAVSLKYDAAKKRQTELTYLDREFPQTI